MFLLTFINLFIEIILNLEKNLNFPYFYIFMISTGSKDLDEFLSGYKDVTIIYGAASTGKTCCCLLAAIEQAKQNKKVLFLDTENSFSLERVKQVNDDEKILDNILVFKIKSFKEQQKRIRELDKIISKSNISLVVIDTIGFFYRTLVKRHSDLANSMLISQVNILKEISKNIPVIIANPVYSGLDDFEKIKIVGGEILKRIADTLIRLEKFDNGKRKLKLIKPKKEEMFFEISDKGIFKI